jgi:hypothetical protein
LGVGSAGVLIVIGQRFAGPTVVHAEKACGEYLPPGPPPPITESQRVAAIAYAACMRHHGLPSFPDPTFNAGGEVLNLPPGLSPSSPAVARAAKACRIAGGND